MWNFKNRNGVKMTVGPGQFYLKQFLLLTAFLFAIVQLHSQTVISGKVKDNKGKPVPGASVSLKDSYDGSVVDSTGNYRFTTSEKGEQILIISNIGYKPFEQTITIGSSPI